MLTHAGYVQEIAEELGMLSSDSSEEDVLTTRVVRRRVIIQVNEHDCVCSASAPVEWWRFSEFWCSAWAFQINPVEYTRLKFIFL